MKLGYQVLNWTGGPPADGAEIFREADRLGYDSAWCPEAYGQDCLTSLAWWGRDTTRIRLGTGLMVMPGRTPASAAMAAVSMDQLSGGRFVLGLGASGPQVASGWYGQPFDRPLARTREYVEIVRAMIAREKPVDHQGEFFQVPYPGGLGKPLKMSLRPPRPDIPIFLGAEGPKNVALAAEIADGWLTWLMGPGADPFYRAALADGFARPGARHTADTFEVAATVRVVVDDDVERAADRVRPHLALYVGGMGAREMNFHYDVMARLGFEDACAKIQELYLSGRRRDAVAAVPTEMVEAVALVGPPEKIRDDLAAWRGTVITTLVVQGDLHAVRTMAELAG